MLIFVDLDIESVCLNLLYDIFVRIRREPYSLGGIQKRVIRKGSNFWDILWVYSRDIVEITQFYLEFYLVILERNKRERLSNI